MLEEYGIIPLTGEACRFYMRVLCDLTPQGIDIITRFFGGTITIKEGTNWNSTGVASIMLPYSVLKDLESFIQQTTSGQQDRNRHQMSGRLI